jgi:hypothetical protein
MEQKVVKLVASESFSFPITQPFAALKLCILFDLLFGKQPDACEEKGHLFLVCRHHHPLSQFLA